MSGVSLGEVGTTSVFPGPNPPETLSGSGGAGTARKPRRSRDAPPELGENQARAHRQFITEVLVAVDAGQRVPCVEDPAGGWTSDEAAAQRRAAALCAVCPLLAQCREYVETYEEEGGVWAGEVRITEVRRRQQATAARSTRKRRAARREQKARSNL